MAITRAALTNGTSDADTTSYNTASISPGGDKLLLCAVAQSAYDSGNNDQPTLSGNGLTWVAIGSIVGAGGWSTYSRITLFRAMGASPSSGAVTISFTNQQDSVLWDIQEFDGVDTSGTNGSGAIVQNATNSGTAASLTVTLSAFGDSANATYGCFERVRDGTVQGQSPGTGFTELTDISLNFYTTYNMMLHVEWRNDNDTTVDSSTSSAWESTTGIAVEIKAGATTITGTAGFASGVASFDATGEREVTGSAGFSAGVASLDAVGEREITGVAAFAAVDSDFSADGTVGSGIFGTAGFEAGVASLDAAGVITRIGVAGFEAGVADFSATGEREVIGSADFGAGTADFSASGSILTVIDAAAAFICASASFDAVGEREITGTADFASGDADFFAAAADIYGLREERTYKVLPETRFMKVPYEERISKVLPEIRIRKV